MTNRASLPLQIVIAAGLSWASLHTPILAETAPAAAPAPQPQSAPVKLPEQRPITVALTTCTRVGNRMVC